MSSSYKSLNLFDSGPHRFIEGPAGQDVYLNLRLGTPVSGSTSIGDAELAVTVTGRLVADEDTLLWSLIDDIKAQLDDWATPGKLIDHQGHEWLDISFVRFIPADRIDRGREVSLAYTAIFIRLPA
ncbi:MAG: hypothetical protein AB7K52_16065 [Phycisphaerales bacterium]